MTVYGNPDASTFLIQMVDDHDLAGMESELAEIRRLSKVDFCLMTLTEKFAQVVALPS